MKPIIDAVNTELLKAELTKDKFVRNTNFGNNQIFIVSYADSPRLVTEVGRLRELTFRYAGGGTGKDCDLDIYDTIDNGYKQLIVWNPEENDIVGGYRFLICDNVPRDKNGELMLATRGLFRFSDKFVNDYLPYTLELGRSFVQPKYQPSVDPRKGLFALDNIWDGLGAIVVENPQLKYMFGKMTMYKSYDKMARDLILYFLRKRFPDDIGLVFAERPIDYYHPESELAKYFTGANFDEDYKNLVKYVRANNENIPPLVNTYIKISPSMKTFGTSDNEHFGDVEETGILVTIADIYESKKNRHIDSYINKK